MLYSLREKKYIKCLNDGGTWLILDANFDNIFHALITVFILCTQENWPFIMYTSMDSNTSDIVNK